MKSTKTVNSTIAKALPLLCMYLFQTLFVSSFSFVSLQAKRPAIFLSMGVESDMNEVVACNIVVKGDVNGGYYRSCVKNEASNFRNLVGTMTPPDNDIAEIYVEGKRKSVEGFVRWCKKADKKVGLSQVIAVESVSYDEEATGLYEDFYIGQN